MLLAEALPPAAKPLNPAAQVLRAESPGRVVGRISFRCWMPGHLLFRSPAQEYLESLETDLLRVDKDAANPDIIHQLFRTAHTLKGSAYTVGFQSIGDLTHPSKISWVRFARAA